MKQKANGPVAKAAIELLDDLSVQICDALAESNWLAVETARITDLIPKTKGQGKRHVLRRRLQALLTAKYYCDVGLVVQQNNRELVFARLAEAGDR